MKRVLVVDDDRENIDLLTQYLSHEGLSVQSAADAESALHRLKAWKPHLILLDVNMPGTSGIELIPKIRAITEHDYVSVVLISGAMTLEDVNKGMNAGADDYLTKPFRSQELISRVRMMLKFKEVQDQLRRANERIEELTSTDELTGLLSFRTLYRRGEEEILRSRRFKKPISALLVNLDKFSRVNQDNGFQFGTHVLQEAGKRLKKCVRNIDMVARIGADEFFVLLMETDLAGAEFVAERVRDALQAEAYKNDKLSVQLTASIGVAGITAEQQDSKMSDLIHSASEALRSAKATGTNKIEVYSFA
jgi:two-component system cell cycle response regulator